MMVFDIVTLSELVAQCERNITVSYWWIVNVSIVCVLIVANTVFTVEIAIVV